MWYEVFKYTMFAPYVRGVMRPKVTGEENIPQTGGALVAANHLSAADTLMLPASIRRKMVFPAKAELFEGKNGFSSKIVAWFLKAVGQLPMDRAGGRATAQGMEPVMDELQAGGLVGIFPEGTRSADGRLYKGRTGVIRLALDANVPVIPVGLVNTYVTKNRIGLPVAKNSEINIGEPIDLSRFRERRSDTKVLREATDTVLREIQKLSGQVYVDVYGNRAKRPGTDPAELDAYVRPFPGYVMPVEKTDEPDVATSE